MKTRLNKTIAKILVASAAGIAGLAISYSAYAWGKGNPEDAILEHVTEELNLTTEQQASLKDVTSTFFTAMKEKRKEHKKLRKEKKESAQELWGKENLLVTDISNYMESERAEHQAQMQKHLKPTLEKLVIFHATLDEEQRLEFAEMMSKTPFFGGHGGRFGGHKRGGRHSFFKGKGKGFDDDQDEDDN